MMTPEAQSIYRDRLTGLCVFSPPLIGMLVGRWILETDSVDVSVNSVAAATGDFLVPEASGLWHVVSHDGERQSGTVARAHMPDDLEAESVRTIGDKLGRLTEGGATWLEWTDVVPMVPEISEHVELLPLELLMQEQRNFGALKMICFRPRAHLHVEIERAPVSKARRVPAAAASYLAAHTEDWDRPLMRGIQPKRILAEVRQDQVDIYENRVVARLLDNLGIYLNRRIQKLRRLLKVFHDKAEYSIDGSYQRNRRMSQLWGESIDADEGRRKAEIALKQLESIKYKLMGLLGSPLYGDVPRRAHVGTTLKSTNILTSDQYYRRVAELWREWGRTGAGRTQSPAEHYAEAQRLCKGLDAFAMLLAVRALDTLGYGPSDATFAEPIFRGTSLSLEGHGLRLTVDWRPDGTIVVRVGDRELTIVSLVANLSNGGDERVRESLSQICESSERRDHHDLLVLFLAPDEEGEGTEIGLLACLHTVGNDPRHPLAGAGCLPVSPWDLGSTERVARALRWFVSSARFLEYPVRVDVPDGARCFIDLQQHARWLASVDRGTTLELRSPAQEYEWEALDLESITKTAKVNLQAARAEHQRLTEELRDAARRGKTGALGHQKRDAHANVLRCEHIAEASHTLAEQLRTAQRKYLELLECPTCGRTADPAHDFQPRDRGSFQCECSGCHTTWGTQLCGDGHRYATMQPKSSVAESVDERPGWVDRIYGSDILAVPARRPDGQWGFVCPDCGRVG